MQESIQSPEFECIAQLIENQPTALSPLANVLRVDLITCRNILRDYDCRCEVDGRNFFKKMEIITLYYQQVVPELALTLYNRSVLIKGQSKRLLHALSMYHSLALSPFFEGEAQMGYLNFYIKELRPLVQKTVRSKLDDMDIGIAIPSSKFELVEEEID